MKKMFKNLLLCTLFMCALFMPVTSATAYDYKYIWSEHFTSEDDTVEFYFMSPQFVYFYDLERYFIPFMIYKDGEIIYKGIAEAPKEMNDKNVLNFLCEESKVDTELEGYEKVQELCEQRKTLKGYEISEFIESELRPLHLVPEALEAQDEYFSFTIQIGSESGNPNASYDANRLRVKLSPHATDVPSWVKDVLGLYFGSLG